MNLPNEAGAWDADFSYGYLELLYKKIQLNFDLCRVGDFPGTAHSGRRCALIRHDVDVSLDRALKLAEREAGWGVGATYHVMIDSPFYDVRSDQPRAVIQSIAEMGHEIGLHYDVVARQTEGAHPAVREMDISMACGVLEEIVDRPVRSLSFHRPIPDVMGGPLHIAGRISGYSAALSRWYLSDSRGRWREGNPIDSLARPRGDTLQILIHPIWWGERNERPANRLRDFLLELSPNSTMRGYGELRTKLWGHIRYRAADYSGCD